MQVVLLTITTLTLILSLVDAARLVFSTSASLSAEHINYSADETQRCYSMSCFDNKAAFVSWEDLASDGRLVFYDGGGCTGSYVKGYDKSSWALEFSTVGFKGKTSSFMVWQYSVYPVNGLVDICEESAIVNNSSSSGSGEAGIIANASAT
ncbi:hypothetical protein PRIC1_009817 [Phytophthora ramorum]